MQIRFNPMAVVFWGFVALGAYLFSGGSVTVMLWWLFGAMAFSFGLTVLNALR